MSGSGTILIDNQANEFPFSIIGELGTFQISWDGGVYANYGIIGPFNLSKYGFMTSDSSGWKSGTFYIGADGLSINNDTFWIDTLGNLRTAGDITLDGMLSVLSGKIISGEDGKYFEFNKTGGTIAGWTIGEDRIYNKENPNSISIWSNGKINMASSSYWMALDDGGFKVGSGTSMGDSQGVTIDSSGVEISFNDEVTGGRWDSSLYLSSSAIAGSSMGRLDLSFKGGGGQIGSIYGSCSAIELTCSTSIVLSTATLTMSQAIFTIFIVKYL
jgi:hypothetical protein